jgi:anti-anti-sigma factor
MSSTFQAPPSGPPDLAGVTVVYRLCCPSVRGPEVERVCGQILPVVRKGPCTLLLDFAEVTFLNAAALGRLVALHGLLRDLGARLVLVNLSPYLRDVFEVTRLDLVLEIRRPGGRGPDDSGSRRPQRREAALR